MRGAILVVGLVGCGKPAEDGGGSVPVAAGPALDVAAQKLYDDYRHGNVAAADAKYKGRRLRVTGRALGVEQEGGGYGLGIETGPSVQIYGRVYKAAVVAAVNDQAAAAKVKDFDTITVEGEFQGRRDASGRMGGMSLRLERARLVSHTPRPKMKDE